MTSHVYLSKRIADRNSALAETHISDGNVPGLARLLRDWSRDDRAQDPRLQKFLERLEEMETIEREHGSFSLSVFKQPNRMIRSVDALKRRETWMRRAADLRTLKGPDWWTWAHRPCLH
jgi:hypothetical protein